METIRIFWDFLQKQILGMKWLDDAVGRGLSAIGLDIESKVGASIQFFLYDTIKITVLLCVLIYLISYSKLFSTRKKQTDFRAFSRHRCKYCCCFTWNGYPVLLLFIDPPFYWFYKCRTSFGGDIFFSYLLPNG